MGQFTIGGALRWLGWVSTAAMALCRCGCGNDDCKCDDVGEGHAEKRIGSDTSERVVCLAGCFQQWLSATVDVYILCFLRGLPKKQVGRDRCAKNGYKSGEIFTAPCNAR